MKLMRIHIKDYFFTVNGYDKSQTGITKIEAYYNEQMPDGTKFCSVLTDYMVAYGSPEGFIIHYEDKVKIIPYSAVTLIEGVKI